MYPPTPASYRNKLIILTALITMIVTSLAWVGIGAVGYWFIYTESPSFEMQVDHPDTVQLGEVVEVKVSVKNTGADDVVLANLDVYNEFTDGFEIIDVSPKPSSSESLWGYHSYNLRKKIAPGDVHDLTLKLRAKEVGLWSGDIDACNIMQNMVTHYTEIEVVDVAVDENPKEESGVSDSDKTEE
jgi:hypothetical protein